VRSRTVEGYGVAGLPEIRAGDDLGALIRDLVGHDLRDGDIVVVTSKVVSKAEGRRLPASERAAAIEGETVRVVAQRGDTRIVETRHGLVLAAAGVDSSNVDSRWVLLLPVDPDESARRIRRSLRGAGGVRVAVVVTDTAGRPWRNGLVDLAIGAAGLQVLEDHRATVDRYGNELRVTVTAVADEVAAFSELLMGKVSHVPVAVVRGLGGFVTEDEGPGARALVRPAHEDLFRQGSVDQ
jgi:coenzyme F420-0:L-glutamate ligase/coenzyme F420-1:gamma-L-glutamate ligase